MAREPLGITNTDFYAQVEGGDGPTMARVQPALGRTGESPTGEPGLWLHLGGRRWFIEDDSWEYALAAVRKCRERESEVT
jgi:hypothetical protein